MQLERDIASDFRGLCGGIQLLLKFIIKLQYSDPMALKEFVYMRSWITRSKI